MTTLVNLFHVFALLLFLGSFGTEVLRVNGYAISTSNIRYFFYQSAEYPRDCREAFEQCSYNNATSGVFLIKPDQISEPIQVYCENNHPSGGWTVIQRRLDGSINFNRTWEDYKHGFGFMGSEFWIGNERLAFLTNQNRYSLRIDLQFTDGQSHYLTYDNFRITDEWDSYSLHSLNFNYDETKANYSGCYVQERDAVLQENESYINSGCSLRTTCNNNRLTSREYRCHNHATCHQQNGVGRCICNRWYVGNGVTCTIHPCYVQEKGRTLTKGESYINSVCSSTITCKNNRLDSQPYSCSNHASCENSNGVGRCVCNQYYVGDGVTCTLHPCYDGDKARILSEGESYINSACSSTITCRNNHLDSQSYSCSNNARCENRNGVGRCICNEGFVGDGVSCPRHPCFVGERNLVLPEGESYVNSACSSTISCRNSRLNSRRYSCSNDGSCEHRNGIGRCVCNEGFTGNGVVCDPLPCYVREINRVLLDRETYINPVCTRNSTCNGNSLNVDRNYRCSNHATCDERKGVRKCYCNDGYEGNGVICNPEVVPKDCQELFNAGTRTNGVYRIYPDGYSGGVQVYCEMESNGGGWTMVQRRSSASLDFYRYWSEYKNGFGSPSQDHWLGNKYIHAITNQKTYQLRIELRDSRSSSYYAIYSSFRISNEVDKYRLSIGSYSGNAGYNSLYNCNNKQFSTRDQDNDGWSDFNCAEQHRGGWWFYYRNGHNCASSSSRCREWCPTDERSCGYFPVGSGCAICADSHLNGDYDEAIRGRNIYWDYLSGYDCGIQYTEMKIRPL